MSVEAKALEVELALVRPEILLVVGRLTRYWNLVDEINWVGGRTVSVSHEMAAVGHDHDTPFVALLGLSEVQQRAVDYLRQRGHPELTEVQVRRIFHVPK